MGEFQNLVQHNEILLLNISIEKLNKLLFMTARRSTFRQSRLNY